TEALVGKRDPDRSASDNRRRDSEEMNDGKRPPGGLRDAHGTSQYPDVRGEQVKAGGKAVEVVNPLRQPHVFVAFRCVLLRPPQILGSKLSQAPANVQPEIR